MLFNPSREQVRQFFLDTWAKYQAQQLLAGLETTALDVILQHPEYHDFLQQKEKSLEAEFTPEGGRINPFLHLSLHLAVEEQLSIDQPRGIRAAFEALASGSDEHQAKHVILECLGEIIWYAQRNKMPPDSDAYLDAIRRKINSRSNC